MPLPDVAPALFADREHADAPAALSHVSLLSMAIGLFLLDLLLRRVRIFDRKFRPGRRRAFA